MTILDKYKDSFDTAMITANKSMGFHLNAITLASLFLLLTLFRHNLNIIASVSIHSFFLFQTDNSGEALNVLFIHMIIFQWCQFSVKMSLNVVCPYFLYLEHFCIRCSFLHKLISLK